MQAIRHRRLAVALAAAAVVAGLAVATGVSAGQEEPPKACTLIGCSSGVTVRLERLPPRASKARVCVNGRCERARRLQRSRYGQFLVAPLPRSTRRAGATVRIRVAILDKDGRRLRGVTRRVTVRRSQPNGPGCPPICFNAHLELRGDESRRRQR